MKVYVMKWVVLGLMGLSVVMMVQLHKQNDVNVAIGGRVSNIKIPLGSINPVMVYHARKNNYDSSNNNNNTSLNDNDSDDINFDMLLNKNNNDIISNEINQNEFLFETPY
jgi:hypothetical protein